MLLPALLLGVATGLVNFGIVEGSAADTIRLLSKLVFAVEVVITLAAGFRKTSDYNRRLDAFYSSTEDKSLHHVKVMLVALVSTSIISFSVNVAGKQMFADSGILLAAASLVFSILLFVIGYAGFNQRICAADLVEEMTEDEAPADSYSELQKRIIDEVVEQQLFLRPNLKVSDVAELMGTNRNYIYNAINIGLGISFNEFINGYRIGYAKELLLRDKGRTVAEVAAESGFSTESSFYRNFKLFAGCTPESWRSSHPDQ